MLKAGEPRSDLPGTPLLDGLRAIVAAGPKFAPYAPKDLNSLQLSTLRPRFRPLPLLATGY